MITSDMPLRIKSFKELKCIKSVFRFIQAILILTGINQVALLFNNDINDDIMMIKTKTGCTNNWIFLQ